jgi:hypothetical protein
VILQKTCESTTEGVTTMTVDPNSIDLPAFMAEHLQRAEPDLLRSMLPTFVAALMSAEADAICGAPYGERSAERTNSRNGYRTRDFDTRTRSMEVAIPKLREGSYFPDWLLERRRRAERALTTVVATCYLLGVSTRRMEKLVETLGITRLSKSQVSVMARELDAHVEDFRTRPLDQGPYTFLAADALTMKVREGGRVVNTHVLVATGVNADGHREILGLDVCSAESEAGWLTLFRGLNARGLSGVKLVTSDAHSGLVAAVAATLEGGVDPLSRTPGFCGHGSCRRAFFVAFLERCGADLADGGVPPAGVVEGLQVVEDVELGLVPGVETGRRAAGRRARTPASRTRSRPARCRSSPRRCPWRPGRRGDAAPARAGERCTHLRGRCDGSRHAPSRRVGARPW